jgi:hypothetical protein
VWLVRLIGLRHVCAAHGVESQGGRRNDAILGRDSDMEVFWIYFWGIDLMIIVFGTFYGRFLSLGAIAIMIVPMSYNLCFELVDS